MSGKEYEGHSWKQGLERHRVDFKFDHSKKNIPFRGTKEITDASDSEEWFKVRLGQVSLGQVRLGQVKLTSKATKGKIGLQRLTNTSWNDPVEEQERK